MPGEITITKTADELSKIGDPVTYTFEICNVGDVPVNRDASPTRCSVTSRRLPGHVGAGRVRHGERTRTVQPVILTRCRTP